MKFLNKNNLSIIVVALVAGIVIGGWLFGGSSEAEPKAHNHDLQKEEMTIWTCSMHPQIRQQEPSQCPICGMDLIPLENESADSDSMEIRMSQTAMRLADVQTAVVQKAEPLKTIRLNGKVEQDERLLFTQSSHIAGRIEKLNVNFTGEYVSAGQVIAYIYAPDLVTAQEELFEAYRIKDKQPQLYTAAREKLKNWKLSSRQIDTILKSKQPTESFPVIADVSGFVTKKLVNLGDYITKGKELYQIADLSSVWVLFDVYESDLPWIKQGDKVSFTVNSLPGEIYSGIIDYIDPVIDAHTRVTKARVSIKNNNLYLKPQMFVSAIVTASLPNKGQQIVVPKSTVMWTGKRSLVYVKELRENGIYFQMRNVILGPALGDHFIIEQGLETGEEIAINGTFSIDAAAQLAGKTSMMHPDNQNHMSDEMQMIRKQTSMETHTNIVQTSFKVWGNCGMCEERIETAVQALPGVQLADWDTETKQIDVTFDKDKTSLDKIHFTIASVGHDTELYKAEDTVYDDLPGCCKYDRE